MGFCLSFLIQGLCWLASYPQSSCCRAWKLRSQNRPVIPGFHFSNLYFLCLLAFLFIILPVCAHAHGGLKLMLESPLITVHFIHWARVSSHLNNSVPILPVWLPSLSWECYISTLPTLELTGGPSCTPGINKGSRYPMPVFTYRQKALKPLSHLSNTELLILRIFPFLSRFFDISRIGDFPSFDLTF